MVLEKDSSVLGYPGEISKPLDADHHGVCKYESPEDPRYIAVRNVLKSLVGKSKPRGTITCAQHAKFYSRINKTFEHRSAPGKHKSHFKAKFRRLPLSSRIT
jgi:hypothetical protein